MTFNLYRLVLTLCKIGCIVLGLMPSHTCLTLSDCQAQENRNQFNQLLLPTSREAQTVLQRSCQIWSTQPLRSTIAELSTNYPLAIWLDRRIDSSQAVALSRTAESATLGDELARMAISCGAASGLVENVYVIAPANRLARIQRAAVVLHGQLASAQKRIASESCSIAWPDITTSGELLELIRKTWSIELVGGQIPHDLMHEGRLPRCSLATQLALALGGFDLQATLDTSQSSITLKVQPLAMEAAWQDTYPRQLSSSQVRELQQMFPQSTFEILARNSIKLRGETNAHINMLSLDLSEKRPPKKQASPEPQSLLTFEIKAPIPTEAVLNNLAEKLQFELVWSAECTAIHRNRLIKLKVDKATRQQLFEEIGAVAQLLVVDQQTKVLVSPR